MAEPQNRAQLTSAKCSPGRESGLLGAQTPGFFDLTAYPEGARRRLDLHLALVLRARNEAKCALRGLDSDGARALVWVVDELVETNVRGRSDTQIATVMKTQIRLAGTSGLNRFAAMHAATRRQRARDAAIRLGLYRARLSDCGLGVRGRRLHSKQYRQRQRRNPDTAFHLRTPLELEVSNAPHSSVA